MGRHLNLGLKKGRARRDASTDSTGTSCGWFCNLGKYADWFGNKVSTGVKTGVDATMDVGENAVEVVGKTTSRGIGWAKDKLAEGAEAVSETASGAYQGIITTNGKVKEEAKKIGAKIKETAPVVVESVKNFAKDVGAGTGQAVDSVKQFFGNFNFFG